MQLNEFKCDWITLTQWGDEGSELWDLWQDLKGCGDVSEGKVMQYKGESFGSVFFGSAIQKGRPHNMLRVSGEKADQVLPLASGLGDKVKCTRLDLQVTVPVDKVFDSAEMVDKLRGGGWKGRGKTIKRIDGGDGLDTIYIGSRLSEVFARLYVKEVGPPVLRALRYELELKGAKASTVFCALGAGKASMGGLLSWEWGRLPEGAREYAPSIGLVMAGEDPETFAGVKHIADANSTYKWFRKSVMPALRRLLNDHDYGQAVRRLLVGLLEEDSTDR